MAASATGESVGCIGGTQDQISRRDLQALTDTVRREFAQQRQAEFRHITWHVPGLVWSLDDADFGRLATQQLHLHRVRDLTSSQRSTPFMWRAVLRGVKGRPRQGIQLSAPPLACISDGPRRTRQLLTAFSEAFMSASL